MSPVFFSHPVISARSAAEVLLPRPPRYLKTISQNEITSEEKVDDVRVGGMRDFSVRQTCFKYFSWLTTAGNDLPKKVALQHADAVARGRMNSVTEHSCAAPIPSFRKRSRKLFLK